MNISINKKELNNHDLQTLDGEDFKIAINVCLALSDWGYEFQYDLNEIRGFDGCISELAFMIRITPTRLVTFLETLVALELAETRDCLSRLPVILGIKHENEQCH